MKRERRIAVAMRVDEPYPHHQDTLSGVLDYAREHPEWQCIVDEYPTYSQSRRGEQAPPYDGVIARASPELQRRLAGLGIPLVNIWYQHARPEVPGVYPDAAAIGRLMAEHLIDRGFRRLAFISTQKYKLDAEIGRSFADVAAQHEFPCVVGDYRHSEFGDRKAWLTMKRYVEKTLAALDRPVGIFVTMAPMARVFMTMCHDQQQERGRNVGIVCLDNVRTVVELSPQITSIDSNYVRVGHAAAELLDQLMAGAAPPTTTRLIQPKGVIARESTESFAVEDDVVAMALRYISGRFQKPLAIDEIAAAVSTSPRSLQRRFESAMGCSVSAEIRRLRIECAKMLLSEKKLSVDQITREAGFSSAELMNHVFHREVGMSPTAYRKQVRGERVRKGAT